MTQATACVPPRVPAAACHCTVAIALRADILSRELRTGSRAGPSSPFCPVHAAQAWYGHRPGQTRTAAAMVGACCHNMESVLPLSRDTRQMAMYSLLIAMSLTTSGYGHSARYSRMLHLILCPCAFMTERMQRYVFARSRVLDTHVQE
jgi:hypothetical protein